MSPFERWSVWLTTAGTLITGLVYWWMKELMAPMDAWSVINHPLQPWVLKAHILVAPLQIFAVGLITSRHVWRHFRLGVRKGRRSGVLAMAAFGVLVLSGYALQVLTAEALLRALAWIHLLLGVVYSVAVAAHWPATRGRAGTREAGPTERWSGGRPGRRSASGEAPPGALANPPARRRTVGD
jgi:hypothetical protein